MTLRVLGKADLGELFARLRDEGREVIGPTVRDHAIVLDRIEGPEDLPAGWTDAQGPGRYRLEREGDRVFEGYVVGPDSMKQRLFPSREVLYKAERRPDGKVGFTPIVPAPAPTAFLGVRACDLAAAAIQDRTFLGDGPFEEPRYRARREAAMIVAVNCTAPGDLCFCASTKTGPRVTEGADLVLTERPDGFLVEAASPRGEALLEALPTERASDADAAWLHDAMEAATAKMGRAMDTEALPELLFGRLDHPRWQEVAERCLACGNCTNVCPTCFCSATETPSALDGTEAEAVRLWDSCFTADHAYIHGGTVRPRTEDRYRQWLTHKVGSWVAQFGTSGCVGCGRCIAWCPVGIDLTEEVAALREGEGRASLPECATEPARVDDLTPVPAEVVAVTRESADVVTLHVLPRRGVPPHVGTFLPGQFFQVSLPGIGEVPISVSGHDGHALEHTIRAVGATTRALCALSSGGEVGLRGPYGRGWPLERITARPVTLIAGGIGLAPLRAALREMLGRPADFPEVHLVYGARSPDDALYVRETLGWLDEPTCHLHVTVDHATPAWRGHVGVVTRLLDHQSVPADATVLMCGPEVMMRFAVESVRRLGVPDERIWLTMERHMECATGFCGRCQYGPYFVCKDGPVFSYDQVRLLFGREGF